MLKSLTHLLRDIQLFHILRLKSINNTPNAFEHTATTASNVMTSVHDVNSWQTPISSAKLQPLHSAGSTPDALLPTNISAVQPAYQQFNRFKFKHLWRKAHLHQYLLLYPHNPYTKTEAIHLLIPLHLFNPLWRNQDWIPVLNALNSLEVSHTGSHNINYNPFKVFLFVWSFFLTTFISI